jgi:arabinose-5-phosphate isomerase
VPQAISTLSRKHFGCVGIVDHDGRLCGIVTEGDMARNLTRNLSELVVDDIMTRTPKTVRPTVLATAALALLNQHSIGALIVVDDDNRPIGLVHFHDLLRIGVA